MATNKAPGDTASLTEAPANIGEIAESALDALAGMLRGMAQHGFAIGEAEDHEQFVAACEAWARHVLTGAPVPPAATRDGQQIELPPGALRAWADLGQFYRHRRQDERRFVEKRVDGFKELIWEFVDGMREISTSAAEAQEQIDGSLARLEELARTADPDSLRSQLPDIVASISSTVSEQRSLYDRRIRAMGSRMDSLRDDLLTAQRRIQIDGLTKVYNRGAFDEALQRHVDLATLSGQPLALLMIDLDRFKSINDRWGHPAGDQVLMNFADCLSRCFLRRSDFVARYGGEEFAVILFDTTEEQAAKLASRLLSQVREMQIPYNDIMLELTCSIGLTLLRAGDSREQMLSRADEALYLAKTEGRDRAVLF